MLYGEPVWYEPQITVYIHIPNKAIHQGFSDNCKTFQTVNIQWSTSLNSPKNVFGLDTSMCFDVYYVWKWYSGMSPWGNTCLSCCWIENVVKYYDWYVHFCLVHYMMYILLFFFLQPKCSYGITVKCELNLHIIFIFLVLNKKYLLPRFQTFLLFLR